MKRYYGFWPSFFVNFPNDGSRFFDTLLDPLIDPNAIVDIHSVFPEDEGAFESTPAPDLRIAYSGEPFTLPTDAYDLNLVMRPASVAERVVCLPLFVIASHMRNYWPLYRQPRPDPANKRLFCVFVVSNPNAEPPRTRFFEKLSAYKPVCSCGLTLNNCGGFLAPTGGDYFEFLSQFKFMICFENSATPENLTEKLHNAWLGGTIPIHWGGRKCLEWLNPDAFLQLPDAATESDMDALIERIVTLDTDPDAYRAVYDQPLLRTDAIPEEMSLDHLRTQIARIIHPLPCHTDNPSTPQTHNPA